MATRPPAGVVDSRPTMETWQDWTCEVSVWVADHRAAGVAGKIVREVMHDVERSASRFRPDSEVMQLTDGLVHHCSPALISMLSSALNAAQATDGLLDPTLGQVMRSWGYVDALPTVPMGANEVGPRLVISRSASWRDIVIEGNAIRVPKGVLIDLGATAKAWASDQASHRIWGELNTPCVVSIGGDLAVAGPGEFRTVVEVAERPTDESISVLIGPGGLATSSTVRRGWMVNGNRAHHIMNPHLQAPAQGRWRTVSVMAASCVAANHASTAAIVMGASARQWLSNLQLPGRLIANNGEVTYVGQWPEDRDCA